MRLLVNGFSSPWPVYVFLHKIKSLISAPRWECWNSGSSHSTVHLWLPAKWRRGKSKTSFSAGLPSVSKVRLGCDDYERLIVSRSLVCRLVEEAMSGKNLDSSFSLPCPPGFDIPPEVVNPFTSNNLKVNAAFMLTLSHLPKAYRIFD